MAGEVYMVLGPDNVFVALYAYRAAAFDHARRLGDGHVVEAVSPVDRSEGEESRTYLSDRCPWCNTAAGSNHESDCRGKDLPTEKCGAGLRFRVPLAEPFTRRTR
jgi:hypothetical protein